MEKLFSFFQYHFVIMFERSNSYWVLLVAATASFILGGLWYSPILFGNVWMRWSGITESQIQKTKKKGIAKSYLFTFIGSVITAFMLMGLLAGFLTWSFLEGPAVGALVWFGFIAPVTLGSVLWEGKPLKLWCLNNAYHLLSLMLMGAIFAALARFWIPIRYE